MTENFNRGGGFDIAAVKTPLPDPQGESADVVDIFAEPTAAAEILTFEDWHARSGVDELTARRAWSLMESWLWRANRHPRLDELRWALIEIRKPTTADRLRERGYTLNGD